MNFSNLISTIAASLVIYLAGYLALSIFKPTKACHVFLSFPIGAGIISFTLFILSLVLPINKELILLILAIETWFLITKLKLVKNLLHLNLNWVARVQKRWLFISLIFITQLIIALYWPVTDWDAKTLYDFRGKLLVSEGSFFKDSSNIGPSTYYFGVPPLTSILHSIYYFLGSTRPLIIYPLFFSSFVALFYLFLPHLNPFIAFIVSTLSILLPNVFYHFTFPYTNFIYTFYLFAAFLFLGKFLNDHKKIDLILGFTLLGFSAFTRKDDPFWLPILVSFFVIYLFSQKRRIIELIVPVSIFFVLRQAWLYFTQAKYQNYDPSQIAIGLDRSVSLLGTLRLVTLEQIILVTSFIFENYRISKLMALAIVLSLINQLLTKNRSKTVIYTSLVIFLSHGILFAGTFYFSLIYPWWNTLTDSFARFIVIFFPFFLYYISLNLTIPGLASKTKVHG